MEKITFYPIELTYKIKNKHAVIYLYGRDDKGRRVCVTDSHFEPYFYVLPLGDVDTLRAKLLGLKVPSRIDLAEVVRVEEVEKNFLGKTVRVLKVFTQLPFDVPVICEAVLKYPDVKDCYEYDILFTRRYLIDGHVVPLMATLVEGEMTGEQGGMITIDARSVLPSVGDAVLTPRVLAFDIETYNPEGKTMRPEKYPVIMIALYGVVNEKQFQRVITWKRFVSESDSIEFVETEKDALLRFVELVREFDPDVITGYFSDGFDFPYLEARAAINKISLAIGLDGSGIRVNKKAEAVEVTGISHIDVFKFVRRILGRSMQTDVFTLDAVASELIGEHKHEVDLDKLAGAWDAQLAELDKYAAYNLQDARVTYLLCMKVLPNMTELVRIIGLPLATVTRFSFSRLVENYIMRQTAHYNELIPNRPGYADVSNRKTQTYEGAFVFQPTAGLYESVVVFDFRSLYPSIVTSHNISPGSLYCTCCHDVIPGEKYWFCKNKKGFLPIVLENIITLRVEIKKKIKSLLVRDALLEARSESLKLLANSFYGYMGFAAARWYSMESARSITALGRHYIHGVIDMAQKSRFKVLYSDTDSIFLCLDGKMESDALTFVEGINKTLPGIMELDYEGFYPAALFVGAKAGPYGAKKKYAMIDRKGKLKIRGFETVRRNWSVVAKQVQERVLEIVLREKNTAKALLHVKEVIDALRKHTLNVDKVVISTQLQRPIEAYESVGPHVAVAQRMKNRGIDVGPGTIVKFVVGSGKGIIREKAKMPDEIIDNDYDSEYYIAHQVVPSVDRIFAVLGVNVTDIASKKDQSTLGKFFG